ncbi:MAG: hypothetical protein AAF602_32395, partial [Myxococcota bacterium]
MVNALRPLVKSVVLPVWAGLGVITAILAIPGGPTLLTTLTLGLGLVLVPVPTIFVYLTASLPGLLLFGAGGRRWVALALGLVGVLGTATVPAVLAERAGDAVRATFAADDREGLLPAAPRQLRLVKWTGLPQEGRALQYAPCEALCQRLLYGGEVDAIEVRATGGDGVSVTYRRETLPTCPPALASEDALPAVQRAIAKGDCLVPSVGERLYNVPWFRFRAIARPDVRRRSPDSWLRRGTRVKVATAGAAGSSVDDPPVRRHAVSTQVVRAPLGVRLSSTNPSNMDLVWWTRPVSWGAHDSRVAAQEIFGYRLA